MPVLRNARHERFAQDVARGASVANAFKAAGFKPNPGNARRLRANEAVSKRIEALLEQRERSDEAATKIATEKLAISKERVLAELAKLAFADIRKVVRWRSARITEVEVADESGVQIIKNLVTNQIEIIASAEIDDAVAAAISEISQSERGHIRIKLHDKRAALVDLGRHLGMFRERLELSSAPDAAIEGRAAVAEAAKSFETKALKALENMRRSRDAAKEKP